MLETKLMESAEEFARAVAESPVVSAYLKAKAAMEADNELTAVRKEHQRSMEEFRRKQFDGTLAQEDIAAQRKIFERLSTHSTNVRFVEAKEEVQVALRRCNDVMSDLLGFDFATNAAPSSCC